MSVMPRDLPLPLSWLADALLRLWQRDGQLLQLGAGETSLSARLATHLTTLVPDQWDVDAEYDRQNEAWRQKLGVGYTASGKLKRMRPDVAIHVRGERGPESNLLFVELKRQWRGAGNTDDLVKTRAAVRTIGYQYGVVLGLSDCSPVLNLDPVELFNPRWTVFVLNPTISEDAASEFGSPKKLLDGELIFSPEELLQAHRLGQADAAARTERRSAERPTLP